MSCVVLCMCKLPDIFNAFPIDIVVISAVLQTQLIDLRTANYQLKEEKTRKDAGKNLLLLLLYSQSDTAHLASPLLYSSNAAHFASLLICLLSELQQVQNALQAANKDLEKANKVANSFDLSPSLPPSLSFPPSLFSSSSLPPPSLLLLSHDYCLFFPVSPTE